MKYLYIRQNINNPEILIIGDESGFYKAGEINLKSKLSRDKAYTHKGGSKSIQYPRVTDDIELGKNSYNRDHHVHSFVKENCYDLVEYMSEEECTKYDIKTQEGFRCVADPEVCINELYKRINAEINQTDKANLWDIRKGPQDEASTAIFDFIHSDNKEFLLNAFCRMGKTFVVLWSFTYGSDYESAMFISGKTEAIRECRLTPYKCSNFDGIKVIDLNEYDELVKSNSLPKRYIIADTCQELQSRKRSKKEVPQVNLIFFDECHFYNTKNLQNIIKGKYDKIIYMSATPVQLINSGNYSLEKKNIYEFTLVDLYKNLENETLSKNDYILPQMYVPNIESYINALTDNPEIKRSTINYFDNCMNTNGFSFSSFFEMYEDGTFIHNDEVRLFAKALVNLIKEAGTKIKYNGKLQNFMIFMPQQISKTENFVNIIREYLTDKDRVFCMVGNNKDEDGNGSSNDNCLSQIKSSMTRREGLTLVFSYQKLGTGCTIKELQATMFLNDTDNASAILQNLSRCLSIDDKPFNAIHKDYGVVFEMNLARAIIDRFKIITSKYGQYLSEEKGREIFNATRNLMPINEITEFGELRAKELYYEDAFMSISKHGTANIFEISNLSGYELDKLIELLSNIDKINVTEAKLTNAEIENLKKAAKTIAKIKSKNSKSNKSVEKLNDQLAKEKLLALSDYLKTSWYVSDVDNINDYYDFYRDNQEDFELITSINYIDFEEIIIPIINITLFELICKDFSKECAVNDLRFAYDGQFYTPIEIFS